MSYMERDGEPNGGEFTVSVLFDSSEVFTWSGYAELAGDALSRAQTEYDEYRIRTYPGPDSICQVRKVAAKIAENMGHGLVMDTPEGPCCDGTSPCHHEPEPGCDSCCEWGWPCNMAIKAARAVICMLDSRSDES